MIANAVGSCGNEKLFRAHCVGYGNSTLKKYLPIMMSPHFKRFGIFLLLAVALRAEAVRVDVHADRVTGQLRPIWNNFC